MIQFDGRQRIPPAVFNGFGGSQSDVEIKIINTPVGKQLSEDVIPNIIAGLINEQPSTSVAVRPTWPTGVSTAILPWPTPAVATTTTVSVLPNISPAIPSIATQFNPTAVVQSGSFVCGEEGTITPFIQRGVEFPRGRYPWLTAIFHKENFALAFKCGDH